MKFAVKGAAVLAVIATIGWLGLSPSPAHAGEVRVYHLPPGDTPMMGDPDGGNGFAMNPVVATRLTRGSRYLISLRIMVYGGHVFLLTDLRSVAPGITAQ